MLNNKKSAGMHWKLGRKRYLMSEYPLLMKERPKEGTIECGLSREIRR
jgi:hypothetical protein